ncbi:MULTISPECIES: LysR family transcriptional regulator [unclassified Psychrobacter]|uniref:LysR family transcriptional regulator n=1 Tax=unclassified Psychrobacter TaxID=196806 RepID=UPI000EBAA2BA|nr:MULTISPECIES: LysR family transcriptional regulator [unclassified Psychrobacter]MBE8609888.1 LysR family transcriptional regulator [Pseudomonas lundensis]HCI76110.1 LysR family transcriptional regulator [Psychrobacter sp.]
MIEKISLNSLKFFYYVAQHGSVTLASQKLFVTQSAVSKQIKNLEDALGLILFDRVNKKLILTSNGSLLFACCQQVFARLDDCLVDLKNQQYEKKQLVLSCEPTISMKWLIPRLAEFNSLNYGFEIVLLTGGGIVDFQGKSIDIALRRNDFEWDKNIFHEKIIEEYIVAVRNTRTDQTNTLLLTSSRPHLWQHINKSKLVSSDILSYEHMVLEHFYLCIEGCLAGLGTAIVSIFMVEKEISHEFLELVHPPVADSSSYHLLSYYPFYEDERKVIFKNWLKIKMTRSKEQFMKNLQDKL